MMTKILLQLMALCMFVCRICLAVVDTGGYSISAVFSASCYPQKCFQLCSRVVFTPRNATSTMNQHDTTANFAILEVSDELLMNE